jgi:DNA-binding CsgD family transcriptional regulator/DNA-binding Xre family transcriptional regulator
VAAESLARMGYALLELGDRGAARTALEEARALAEATPGSTRALSVAISNLAELERIEGRFDAAAPLYEQTLATHRASGDRQSTMIALNNLAMTALGLGDTARVRTLALESLAICDELDSRRGRLVVMEACAGLAADLGQWHRTTRFDAATRFHTAEMGRHRDAADEVFLASRIELARISLGELGHATATSEGQALAYDAAIDDMRSWLTEIGPITTAEAVARRVAENTQGVRVNDDAVSLTPREREILSLVARGFSNGDIAALLGISVLTVRTHRQRLMEKLELRNAAEITAYAVKQGLYNPS